MSGKTPNPAALRFLGLSLLLVVFCQAPVQAGRSESRTHPTWQTAQRYLLLATPFIGLLALQTYLSIRTAKNPYAQAAVYAVLTPLNIALSAPLFTPLVSKLQHWLFHGAREDVTYQGPLNGTFERLWPRTQGALSMNAQISRNLYGEALQLLHPALLRLRDAPASDSVGVRKKLCHLAEVFSLLYPEIPADDPLVMGFVRAHLDGALLEILRNGPNSCADGAGTLQQQSLWNAWVSPSQSERVKQT